MDRAGLAARLGWVPSNGRLDRNEVLRPSTPESLRLALARAAAGRGCLFLADPAATATEVAALDALSQAPDEGGDPEHGWLCLPTGGSGGRPRYARHDQDTLDAAVEGFRAHFGIDRVNAVGLLPLHHVSGFMAWARCALSGGRYVPWDWKRLEQGERPPPDDGAEDWVLSLVPTQLARVLLQPASVAWLRGMKAVFLGGGPAWPALLDSARAAGIPLAPGYGMTETAAMVTALRPAEFLAGADGVGHPLPHTRIEVSEDGSLKISSPSLFRGYYPAWRAAGPLEPQDLGKRASDGSLCILGRSDAVIISGGKKISPEEVEAALLGTGLVEDAVVAGLPHPAWGQELVAFVSHPIEPDEERMLRELLRGHLPAWKIPKRFLTKMPWPRTAQGKVSRATLVAGWITSAKE
jgi:O-succinylbenzoic acid--CoA ligase